MKAANEPGFRQYVVACLAKDTMEAMMIESFLASRGIEARQPGDRHLFQDFGLGSKTSGSFGIRIEVPIDQVEEAKQVLAEHQDLMDRGLIDPVTQEMTDANPEDVAARRKEQELPRADAIVGGSGFALRVAGTIAGLGMIVFGVSTYLDIIGPEERKRQALQECILLSTAGAGLAGAAWIAGASRKRKEEVAAKDSGGGRFEV